MARVRKGPIFVALVLGGVILGGLYLFLFRGVDLSVSDLGDFSVSNRGKGDRSKSQVRIGVVKIVDHSALNEIEKGVVDVVHEALPNVYIDLQNAEGDWRQAIDIAKKFRADKVSLAVGIATPAAMALAEVMDTTPIVFSGVTNPEGAGLTSLAGSPRENITGHSDQLPVDVQLNILQELMPRLLVLGYIYTALEPNAVMIFEQLRAISEERGIELLPAPVVSRAEVKRAAAALAPRVEAFYVGTDNMVFTELSSLALEAKKANVPVMISQGGSSPEEQVLLGVGFDYVLMGRKTGETVVDVLREKPISEIPVQYAEEDEALTFYLNVDLGNRLQQVEVSDKLEKMANIVKKNGQVLIQK